MSVLFTTVYSGVALNTDLTKGVVDRFRSLPIWRPAPLVGALLGDSVRYVLAGTVIIALGLVLGFRPSAGVGGGSAGARCRLRVRALLGLHHHGAPDAVAQRRAQRRLPGALPTTFLSNVFVEPETLPAALEAFVVNPISILSTASRGLMDGSAQAEDVLIHLAWPPP